MDLQAALEHRDRVEEFQRKHRIGLLTLLFTDIVGSTQLKQQLGDREAVVLIQQHHAVIRDLRHLFAEAEEIGTAGDSFFMVFARPSDAVKFSLLLQDKLRRLAQVNSRPVLDRIGIHVGEVFIGEEISGRPKDLYGVQVDTCARVMSMGGADQILMSRSVFDAARQVLRGKDIQDFGPLSWMNHGPYLLKGVEEPVEICEVGEIGKAVLRPPGDSEKVHRSISPDREPVLGWRPAVEQIVPNSKWVLEEKLGEGGFGEVWLARHETLKEQRVFKFCFRADRVRSLKREVTIFRLLKERVGEHPNIVGVQEVYFDEPPYYIMMEYAPGKDLKAWQEQPGGIKAIPFSARLEIVAQVADALEAAHKAGVIHRDVKPTNILVGADVRRLAESSKNRLQDSARRLLHQDLVVKLTDFGIGQVLSEETLAGMTRLGFTQTLMSTGFSNQSGTQLYMAPELLAGGRASPQSDIYSLGVVLYQLLLGDISRPLTTDWRRHIDEPFLREVLEKCFASDLQERFSGADELAVSLRTIEDRRRALTEQETVRAARERAAYRRGVMRTAGVAVIGVGSFAFLALYAFQEAHRAEIQATRADRSSKEETHQRRLAESAASILRQNLYVADINIASQALEDNNIGRAQGVLQKYAEKTAGQDLRGFEWYYLWRLSQGDEIFSFESKEKIESVGFAANGKALVMGGNRKITIYDAASREVIKVLTNFSGNIVQTQMALTPDGTILAASDNESLVLFSTATWELLRTLPNAKAELTFGLDGKILMAATRDGITLWDLVSGQPTRLTQPEMREQSLSALPDGTVVAGHFFGGLDHWDLKSQSKLGSFKGLKGPAARQTASRDGNFVAMGNFDGGIAVWNTRTHTLLWSTNAHSVFCFGLDFSPESKTLASAGEDHLIRLWESATGRLLKTLRGHRSGIWMVKFSPDGKTLVSMDKEGKVKLWSAELSPDQNQFAKGGSGESIFPIWFSTDGKVLAMARKAGFWGEQKLEFWSVPTRTQIAPFPPLENYSDPNLFDAGIGDPAQRGFISKDGQMLAVGNADGSLSRWALSMGKRRTTFQGLTNAIQWVEGSQAGGRIAAADVRGNTCVWNMGSDRAEMTFEGCYKPLAFSPNGMVLAAAGTNDAPIVCNLVTKKTTVLAMGHIGPIIAMVFSPDGQILVSTSRDNTARLWDVSSGRLLAVLRAHKVGVAWAAFSPDGKTLVTTSDDRTIRLWNMATRQELMTLGRFIKPAARLIFSEDGNTLAAGFHGDEPVQLWDVGKSKVTSRFCCGDDAWLTE